MQIATLRAPPQLPMAASDPLRTSVGHLLSRAYTLPCSTAAQAFNQLVQPTSRFQLALDALLPLLDARVQLEQRILVSYILYSLYAPHPISINPFKSALYASFVKEREAAMTIAAGGGVGENEQLVWVLWKILKGDGNDLGPYSPSTLARSPLPPRLRASKLTLEEENQVSDSSEPDDAFVVVDKRGTALKPISGGHTPTVTEEPRITAEQDEKNERISQGISLLLAGRSRVLTLSEQRLVGSLIPDLVFPSMLTSLDLPPLISHNPTLAHPLMVALISLPASTSNPQGAATYLDVLKRLPPTLPSFDLFGRLLRDPTQMTDAITGGKITIADLVRTDSLGGFIHEGIRWLENAEREEREGSISDDRFAKGVQNLCRFYNSLIKYGIVDPSSDTDSTEMMHFSLRHSRFEDANALYRGLATGHF